MSGGGFQVSAIGYQGLARRADPASRQNQIWGYAEAGARQLDCHGPSGLAMTKVEAGMTYDINVKKLNMAVDLTKCFGMG